MVEQERYTDKELEQLAEQRKRANRIAREEVARRRQQRADDMYRTSASHRRDHEIAAEFRERDRKIAYLRAGLKAVSDASALMEVITNGDFKAIAAALSGRLQIAQNVLAGTWRPEPRGFFNQLSPEQQKATLEYEGPDTLENSQTESKTPDDGAHTDLLHAGDPADAATETSEPGTGEADSAETQSPHAPDEAS